MSDKPIGQRFSQVYLERGAALRDSPRFRKRLERLFSWAKGKTHIDLGSAIEAETGCKVPSGSFDYIWSDFFSKGEMRDVLDAITIVYNGLSLDRFNEHDTEWRDGVRRIMQEENIGYRLDDAAGVHFVIDEEFERSRVTLLAGLALARYGSARNDFELAHTALDRDPPNTRAAVRHVFDSLETVFKLIFDDASRLDAAAIEKKLTPVVLSFYDGAARNNVGRMLVSFKEWTNGAHQYRHAQGVEQPTPPPIELCVMIVSSGATWLRWLVEIDTRIASSR